MAVTDELQVIQFGVVSRKGTMYDALAYGNNYRVYLVLKPLNSLDYDNLDLETIGGENVPLEHIYPSLDGHSFTVASEPIPDGVFVKEPCLLRYKIHGIKDDHIGELLLNEALFCEVLLRHPHPNVASYLGCRGRNGRITALCYKKYRETLNDALQTCPSTIDREQCLREVRNGIAHIHSLGYAHNDISPHNIMLDDRHKAVIIDFDSCRRIGSSLGPKTGTREFFDVKTKTSETRNDYFGLRKVEEFLYNLTNTTNSDSGSKKPEGSVSADSESRWF